MNIRVGVSGWANEITSYLNDPRFARINHYSLALRTNSSPLDDKLVKMINDRDVTISIHPVDFNFSDSIELSEARKLKDLISDIPVSYVEEDAGIWLCGKSFMLSHQLNPKQTKESIEITAYNIQKFREIIDIDFLIENAPIYSIHGDMRCADYYSGICHKAECDLAFDVGHYVGMANKNSNFLMLPEIEHPMWEFVRSIHISGIKRWNWNGIPVWIDQHSDKLSSYLIKNLQHCILRSPKLENILLEQEGSSIDTKLSSARIVDSIILQEGVYDVF